VLSRALPHPGLALHLASSSLRLYRKLASTNPDCPARRRLI